MGYSMRIYTQRYVNPLDMKTRTGAESEGFAFNFENNPEAFSK